MAINVSRANQTINTIVSLINRYNSMSTCLNNSRDTINSNWQSDEINFINSCISNVLNRISKLKSDSQNIGSSVSSAVSQIRTEEQQQAAAMARAAQSKQR